MVANPDDRFSRDEVHISSEATLISQRQADDDDDDSDDDDEHEHHNLSEKKRKRKKKKKKRTNGLVTLTWDLINPG